MSALNMLAEQSPLAATAFTTADAVTAAPPAFDTGPAFPGDFLGLSLQDDEHIWGLSPMSPSLTTWNPKPEPTFANANLERDLKNSRVRNGQPTPPLDDKGPSPSGDLLTALSSNSWNDTQTPTSSDGRHRKSPSDPTSTYQNGSSKRRRVRDNKTTTAASSSGAESDDQKQEREKREKFLERNRLAASKCRQKKKEHTMMLETRYKEQSDKKEELVAEIARLRSEILGLKNEVLKHAQCGDEPIKLHLAQMVKKITYNDTAEIRDPNEVTNPAAAAATTAADPGTSPSSLRGSVSFGFDDPLQLDPSASAATLEQQIRRDSEASMAFSADDNFDDLINV
ncbi:hypothetical protein VTN77DRAFT_3835 [Rasamsonia byssochlamydoides]|uniref:uncharacterized protein n=1 Tax=Rasamsonia byssochlamydoides TaxID=89139 RepID=UPI003742E4A7